MNTSKDGRLLRFSQRLRRRLSRKRNRVWRRVSIYDLRCQRRPYSELQGFSGQPIHRFPPCGFFKLYLHDPAAGSAAFCSWYREWFIERRAWEVPKSQGGMAGGSLARTVARLHRERTGSDLSSVGDAKRPIVEKAINIRVRYYLDLLESIRRRGFKASLRPRIQCLQIEDGILHIENGHHRVSALWVLGIREVEVAILHDAE